MNTGYQITQLKPSYILAFHNHGKEVGSFDFNEGRMHFEGDVSESGKVFVDWVIKSFQQRIDDAVKAEREACAKIVDQYVGQDLEHNFSALIAHNIRARG